MAAVVGAVEHGQTAHGLFGRTIAPLAAFAAVMLLGHLLDALIIPLEYLVTSRIDGAHRAAVARLAAASPTVAALERPDVQDLIRLAAADPANWTEKTPGDGALAQLRLLSQYTGLASSCAVLAAYSPWLVPALVLPALAGRAIQRRQVLGFIRLWVDGVPQGRRADYWREIATSPAEGKELRVFGFGGWAIDRGQRHLRAMSVPVWERGIRAIRRPWTQVLLCAVPLATVYGLVAAGTAGGRHSVAVETAVLGAGWSVYLALGMIGDSLGIEGALPGLRAFQELRATLGGQAAAAPALLPAGPFRPAAAQAMRPPLVRFDEVCFRYQGSERAVLDRLDLEIRPGELLAIVGPNGAGKSTLIKLLAGLYEPDSGRITADGTDIRVCLDAWRRTISVVFQDFARYQLTARDNVALGQARLPQHPDAMRAAAREAGLDAVLGQLPDGWDTPLARSRTGGVDLSGGQWQQVVLARALYAVRTGARLLVLDEPTAHLDVRTEFELFGRLAARAGKSSAGGTGVVLISHRLSTVRRADRIVLLDGGRITESGSHAELMALGGTYAGMFALQAERFSRGYDDRVDEGDVA